MKTFLPNLKKYTLSARISSQREGGQTVSLVGSKRRTQLAGF
jgi:hypothetical protein